MEQTTNDLFSIIFVADYVVLPLFRNAFCFIVSNCNIIFWIRFLKKNLLIFSDEYWYISLHNIKIADLRGFFSQ